MVSTVQRIRDMENEAKIEARAAYFNIVKREASGEALPADAGALAEILPVIGKTAAAFQADVQKYGRVVALQQNITALGDPAHTRKVVAERNATLEAAAKSFEAARRAMERAQVDFDAAWSVSVQRQRLEQDLSIAREACDFID